MTTIATSLLVALFVLNILATLAVLRKDELSGRKRAVQIVLIWLIPCIGAIACLAFIATDTLHENVGSDTTSFVDNAGASFPLSASNADSGSSGGDGE